MTATRTHTYTYTRTETHHCTVTVGPFPIFFGNVNDEMGLPGHFHTAAVTLVYDTLASHGFPSFADTNDAIRLRLKDSTGFKRMFRDATNEDVTNQLWDLFDGYVAPEWEPWGGNYQLCALHLDVQGVHDEIGHDASTTRYTVQRRHVHNAARGDR